MTPDQAAQRVGVTPRTIDRWIASGRLEARRVRYGGMLRLDITIGQLMDAERVRPNHPGPKRKDTQ